MDLQLSLIKTFGWSLAELDRTEAVSLFDFVRHIGGQNAPKRLYAEDVDW